MSTFFLSISGGADVLLADAGGTFLAYQAGSVEGGGGTVNYTFTPTFDTSLISLPSDIEVWYSTDNATFSRTAGLTGATWTDGVLGVELTGSGTIHAALFYAGSGVRVADETGSDIASVSAAYGGGATPVIGAVTIEETTGSPYDADGLTEYTFTINTDNATAGDLTYAWTVASAAGGTFDVTTPLTGTSINVQFDDASTAYQINCQVSSVTATGDSPQDATEVEITTEAAAGPVLVFHDDFTAESAAINPAIDNSTTRAPNTVGGGTYALELHRTTDTTTEWSIGKAGTGNAVETASRLWVSANGTSNFDNEVVFDIGQTSYVLEAIFCPKINTNAQLGLIVSSDKTDYTRIDLNQQSGLIRIYTPSGTTTELLSSFSLSRDKFYFLQATIEADVVTSVKCYEGNNTDISSANPTTGTEVLNWSGSIACAGAGTYCGWTAQQSNEVVNSAVFLFDFKGYTL